MPIVKLTIEVTNEEGLTTIGQVNQKIANDERDLGRLIRNLIECLHVQSWFEWDALLVLISALYYHIDGMRPDCRPTYKAIEDALLPHVRD